MKRIFKHNNGITLIALVVTIASMLALSGIVIALVLGDNGVIKRASQASETNDMEQVREIVALAANTVRIESYSRPMTREDVRKSLEEILSETSPAVVTTVADGYIVEFMGYIFKVSNDFSYVTNAAFDPEEWNKQVTPEEAFIWASENENDGELYHTIIGYRETLSKYTVLRVPTRCHEMRIQYIAENNTGRDGDTWGVNSQVSRMFDQSLGRDQLRRNYKSRIATNGDKT